MANKRPVLVTGANGFIGSHLAEALIERGESVRALVRRTGDLKWLPAAAERVYGDVADPASLPDAADGVRRVYHVAGVIAAFRGRTFDEVNEQGTRSLMLACRKVAPDLERFVLISSVAAGGPSRDGRPKKESDRPKPVSIYGRSKLGGELAALEAAGEIPVTIIRPPVIYGPRDSGVFEFFKMAVGGTYPRFPRDKYYSLCHSADLVRGILAAGDARAAIGQTYHIADSRAYSMRCLLEEVARSIGASPRWVPVPEPLLRLAGPAADAICSGLGIRARPLADKVRELLPDYWVVDVSKARRELGFEAGVSLRAGMEETAAFYRSEGWI